LSLSTAIAWSGGLVVSAGDGDQHVAAVERFGFDPAEALAK
jgi:hypothetical protein